MQEKINEIKKNLEKLEALTSGEEQAALKEQVAELKSNLEKFGDALADEVDLWEREREDVYEQKNEKIKEFRKIIESLKN